MLVSEFSTESRRARVRSAIELSEASQLTRLDSDMRLIGRIVLNLEGFSVKISQGEAEQHISA